MESPVDAASRRQLQERLQNSLKATLLRGQGANQDETIDMTWNITGFSEDGIEIQFEFSNPKQISTSDESDVVIVQISDITAFVGQNG